MAEEYEPIPAGENARKLHRLQSRSLLYYPAAVVFAAACTLAAWAFGFPALSALPMGSIVLPIGLLLAHNKYELAMEQITVRENIVLLNNALVGQVTCDVIVDERWMVVESDHSELDPQDRARLYRAANGELETPIDFVLFNKDITKARDAFPIPNPTVGASTDQALPIENADPIHWDSDRLKAENNLRHTELCYHIARLRSTSLGRRIQLTREIVIGVIVTLIFRSNGEPLMLPAIGLVLVGIVQILRQLSLVKTNIQMALTEQEVAADLVSLNQTNFWIRGLVTGDASLYMATAQGIRLDRGGLREAMNFLYIWIGLGIPTFIDGEEISALQALIDWEEQVISAFEEQQKPKRQANKAAAEPNPFPTLPETEVTISKSFDFGPPLLDLKTAGKCLKVTAIGDRSLEVSEVHEIASLARDEDLELIDFEGSTYSVDRFKGKHLRI